MLALKKTNEGAVLGFCTRDSLIDMTERDLTLEDNVPLWKVRGEKDLYLCTGDLCFASDILRYSDSIFKGITDAQSVLKNVVPKMKELLGEASLLSKEQRWDGPLFIIKGSRVFQISPYFTVNEIESDTGVFYSNYIKGALEDAQELSPEESILYAARTTSALTGKSWFPLVIFNTKTKKKKIYYKEGNNEI